MTVYLSEIRFENSLDFVEIVATDGEDLSGYSIAVYDSGGALQYSQSLAGTYVTSMAGNDGYLIERSDGLPDMGNNWAIALIDDMGNPVQFIGADFPVTAVDGPLAGQTSIGLGNITSGGDSVQTSDQGATYYQQTSPDPGTIPCYAPGTLIDTPKGPRAVETLMPGDLVLTIDHGPQPNRWTRCSAHPLADVPSESKPVQIKAGALDRNLPSIDLIVSPQHRILIGGAKQLDSLFHTEAFAPEKSLTSMPGIRHMKGQRDITWIHFALDRHEVVTANGCQSESLLLGPVVVNGLDPAERKTLIHLFGPPRAPDAALNGPAARDCLTVGAVKRQLSGHRKFASGRSARRRLMVNETLAIQTRDSDCLAVATSPLMHLSGPGVS